MTINELISILSKYDKELLLIIRKEFNEDENLKSCLTILDSNGYIRVNIFIPD